MFQVNDLIVYGNHGVCKVENVGTLSISMADKQKQYYTLRPVYQHESVIYAPVDNNKTIMRFVLSKEEVEDLIQDIPNIESAWIGNEREREVQYRAALQTCDCRELVKIIKTLYHRKNQGFRTARKLQWWMKNISDKLRNSYMVSWLLHLKCRRMRLVRILRIVLNKRNRGWGYARFMNGAWQRAGKQICNRGCSERC